MPSVRGRLVDKRAVVTVGIQCNPVDPSGNFISEAQLEILEFSGLIDTGAQVTLVTNSALRRLRLRPLGKRPLGNVSNISIHRTYSFKPGVWYSRDEGASLAPSRGYFSFDPILGCDFPDRPDFDVLIGMDLIMQGDLHIFRDGEFEWHLGRK
jgi:hypothetical protein